MSEKIRQWLLAHLDPGRQDRGLAQFERPGSINFSTERVVEAEKVRHEQEARLQEEHERNHIAAANAPDRSVGSSW